MLVQTNDVDILRSDDGVGSVEDLFRRASFHWAVSTKRLVESSAALGKNTRVAYSALADIAYARDLLSKLHLPLVAKAPDRHSSNVDSLTAESVLGCVADLVARAEIVSVPVSTLSKRKRNPKDHSGADLTAPVWPKNGKMLWSGVDCPMFPSVAGERCRKENGDFIEKPHHQRKPVVSKASIPEIDEVTAA